MATQDRYPISDYQIENWKRPPANTDNLWSYVDETPADDSTTFIFNYVSSNQTYIANITPFSIPVGATVSKVTLAWRHTRDLDTGYSKAAIRVGGTIYFGDLITEVNYVTSTYDWSQNPKSGTDWTVNDVNGSGGNALQGIGVNSTPNAYGSVFVTQIYATVTYTLNLATVTTSVVTGILINTATGHGEVTADGGAAVTERGVCWKTSTGPTTADSKTTSGTGTGIFDPSITGLAPGVLYYVRAYAINSVGTAYGSEVTFTSGAAIGSGGSGACSSGFPLTTDGW